MALIKCLDCGEEISDSATRCPNCGRPRFPIASADSNKIAAGLCGILLGGFGVHKFMLGYTKAGIIMLCVSLLTCGILSPVMHVIGIIEGIIYLTKSDDDFRSTYVDGKKEWF